MKYPIGSEYGKVWVYEFNYDLLNKHNAAISYRADFYLIILEIIHKCLHFL